MNNSELPKKNSIMLGISTALVIISGFLPVLLIVKLGIYSLSSATIIYSLSVFIVLGFIMLSKIAKPQQDLRFGEDYLEYFGDGAFLFNKAGEIDYISNSAKKLFSCQKFELSQTGLFDRTHIMDRPSYLNAISKARMNMQKQTITIRMRKDNLTSNQIAAEFIWVEIVFSPIVNKGMNRVKNTGNHEKEPHEIIALFKDVSKQKHEMEQLLEVKKIEKTDSDTKTQFLAMIGHELRTPLNSIVGFSDLMISNIGGEIAPKQMEYVKNISQSGYHLLGVVNSLLDMSKLEAGKFELSVAKFDLATIIEPCIQIVSKLAQDKNIKIEIEIDENLPEIFADERACTQIVINLLSNAIKFSKKNTSVVCAVKRAGHFLSLSVKDTGIGMDKEHVAKFGEPFLQAHVGPTRSYEGTGLGVSIVKGLVDLHQGNLVVKSKLGIGTIISVSLPIGEPVLARDGQNNIMYKQRYFKEEEMIDEQRKAV